MMGEENEDNFLEIIDLNYSNLKYSKLRIQANKELLAKSNLIATVFEDLHHLNVELKGLRMDLRGKVKVAQTVSRKLEEYQIMITDKRQSLSQMELEMKKFKLTEEEKNLLASIDLSTSHSDLLDPIRKLLEIRKSAYLQSDPDLTQIIEGTNSKVENWFDKNISSIHLDYVHPSMCTLVEYMIEIRGLEWFTKTFAERRSNIKLRSFLEALAIGGRTKPIELHSHAPFRYISDMLAWLHEAFANELDLIELLLPNYDGKHLAASILVPCATECKYRVASSMEHIDTVSACFQTLLLISYYQQWFGTRLLQGENLLAILTSLKDLCAERIESLITRLQSSNSKPSYDLKPGAEVMDVANELSNIRRIYETALGPSNAVCLFNQVHEQLKQCFEIVIAKASEQLAPYESSIFICNCFGYLSSKEGTDTSDSFEFFLNTVQNVKMHLISALFQKAMLPADICLDTNPKDAAGILTKLTKVFIVHSGWDWLKDESRLSNISIRMKLINEANETFFEFYERLWALLDSPEPDILPPDTVKLLLSAR